MFLKVLQYPQETPVLESLFKKVASLKVCNFIKKRPQHRCFLVNIAKFLKLPILKNIFERLLFDCFNGSLLHGRKGSRYRLYNDVRLQCPSHKSPFLFLSRHLSSWAVPTCAKTNTFDESIKCLHWLFLIVLHCFRSF